MIPLRDNLPTSRTPVVTLALIALNVVAYFFWQRGGISLGDPSTPHYMQNLIDHAAIPYELTHPGKHCGLLASGAVACEGQAGVSGSAPAQPATWTTPFTAMFMHGGLLHLGGNMLFLWIFGNNVEDAAGHVKYLVFYVAGGLAALALQVLVAPSSTVPTIGASGAIAAVLGAHIVLFPRAKVLTFVFLLFFFTFLELPGFVVLGLWFLQQAAFGVFDLANPSGGGGGVAYFAHVGGFVFGLLAVRLIAKRPAPPRTSWAR